jgi:hypothetical protein
MLPYRNHLIFIAIDLRNKLVYLLDNVLEMFVILDVNVETLKIKLGFKKLLTNYFWFSASISLNLLKIRARPMLLFGI